MKPGTGFIGAVSRRMAPEKPADPKSVFGYPVVSSDEVGLTTWFKKNKHVAGMAMGGGLNGTPIEEPRTVVANPYNKSMKDEGNRKALYELEASRHVMDEAKFVPKFKITPEIEQWRRSKFPKDSPYLKNDRDFRETVLSRALVGDDAPKSPEIDRELAQVQALMKQRAAESTSFLKNVQKRGSK